MTRRSSLFVIGSFTFDMFRRCSFACTWVCWLLFEVSVWCLWWRHLHCSNRQGFREPQSVLKWLLEKQFQQSLSWTMMSFLSYTFFERNSGHSCRRWPWEQSQHFIFYHSEFWYGQALNWREETLFLMESLLTVCFQDFNSSSWMKVER